MAPAQSAGVSHIFIKVSSRWVWPWGINWSAPSMGVSPLGCEDDLFILRCIVHMGLWPEAGKLSLYVMDNIGKQHSMERSAQRFKIVCLVPHKCLKVTSRSFQCAYNILEQLYYLTEYSETALNAKIGSWKSQRLKMVCLVPKKWLKGIWSSFQCYILCSYLRCVSSSNTITDQNMSQVISMER